MAKAEKTMRMVQLISPYCVETNPAQQGSTGEPSLGTKHICLPFTSEAQYRAYVDDPAQYRQYLTQMLRQYPELFRQIKCL